MLLDVGCKSMFYSIMSPVLVLLCGMLCLVKGLAAVYNCGGIALHGLSWSLSLASGLVAWLSAHCCCAALQAGVEAFTLLLNIPKSFRDYPKWRFLLFGMTSLLEFIFLRSALLTARMAITYGIYAFWLYGLMLLVRLVHLLGDAAPRMAAVRSEAWNIACKHGAGVARRIMANAVHWHLPMSNWVALAGRCLCRVAPTSLQARLAEDDVKRRWPMYASTWSEAVLILVLCVHAFDGRSVAILGLGLRMCSWHAASKDDCRFITMILFQSLASSPVLHLLYAALSFCTPLFPPPLEEHSRAIGQVRSDDVEDADLREALARSRVDFHDGVEHGNQRSDDADMAAAMALSLLESGGKSGGLLPAADELLRNLGNILVRGETKSLRRRMVEPNGWCYLNACLQEMGDISGRGLTQEGLFLSMLEELCEQRLAYENSVAPDAAEELRRRAAVEKQDKYAAWLPAFKYFDVYVLDKVEALLAKAQVLDDRNYADTPEIMVFLKACNVSSCNLLPGNMLQEGQPCALIVRPDGEAQQIESINELRSYWQQNAFDFLFLHYHEPCFKHYDIVEFEDGSPWQLETSARERVLKFFLDSFSAQQMAMGEADAVREYFLRKLGHECNDIEKDKDAKDTDSDEADSDASVENNDGACKGDDDSNVASDEKEEGREDVLSDISSDSDFEAPSCYQERTWQTPEDADLQIIRKIAAQLRDFPLCPPDELDATKSWTHVHTGIAIKHLHCAFRGCNWTHDATNNGDVLADHVRRAHLRALDLPHDSEMDFYVAAIEMKEREHMPAVGPSIDRRQFGHLQQFASSARVHSLICFICAQIKTDTTGSIRNECPESLFQRNLCGSNHAYIPWHGRNCDISYRRGAWLSRAKENNPHKIISNMGVAEFKRHFVTNTSSEQHMRWPELEPNQWEWKRRFRFSAKPDDVIEVLCCPEDLQACGRCHGPEEVCWECRIPICRECREHLCEKEEGRYRIPMALVLVGILRWTGSLQQFIFAIRMFCVSFLSLELQIKAGSSLNS